MTTAILDFVSSETFYNEEDDATDGWQTLCLLMESHRVLHIHYDTPATPLDTNWGWRVNGKRSSAHYDTLLEALQAVRA